jgi:malonyl CoA-acyl carrier protein transacylase
MTKAVMFPGQGAQHRGMGRGLFDRFPDLVGDAADVLGYDLRGLCLDDPDDVLGQTRFTQPAMYVVNALAHRAAMQEDGPPDMVAGHSLGEYNALEAAGVFDFATGLRLVAARAEAMSEITGGGMCAVVGLSHTVVRYVLLRAGFGDLEPANLNTATQVVLSGPVEDLAEVAPIMEDFGARMVRRLDVSGPFHSRWMTPAAEVLAEVVAGTRFAEPRIPVLANRTATPYTRERAAELLIEQVDHPVLWHDTVLALLAEPDPHLVEIGESTVLSGMVRTIRREQAREQRPAVVA